LNKLSEASDLQLKVEKRDRLPDLNVDFGYKNQSDGSEGFVIGGSIKVPIFNQNSGNVTIARAEARSRQTSVQLKQLQIRNEVETTYQRVQLLMEQWQSQQEQAIKPSFLETARFSYSEGAYSLVELLDALQAYVEGRSITYETISAYNQALYELDLVSGGTLNSTLNTQN
jgi:outer membrane protein TolC